VLKIRHWTFSPSLWPSIAVALLLPLLLSLGFWQLDRAEEKRIQQETFMQRQTAAPINLNMNRDMLNNPGEILWQRVTATGVFEEDKIILLDNQVINAQAGYFVFTPFLMRGELKYILVNRGWVPRPAAGEPAPEVSVGSAARAIRGRVGYLPRIGIRSGGPFESGADWPKIGTYPTLEDLSGQLGQELLPFILLLSPEDDDGYERHWQPRERGPMMHYGYAFQWFAMATAVLGMLLWRMRKGRS